MGEPHSPGRWPRGQRWAEVRVEAVGSATGGRGEEAGVKSVAMATWPGRKARGSVS